MRLLDGLLDLVAVGKSCHKALSMEKMILFGCKGLSCGFLGRGLCVSLLSIPKKCAFGNSCDKAKVVV